MRPGAPEARSPRSRARGFARRAVRALGSVDAALLLVAVLFASVTLGYPFGRDQGLFAFVGRRWFFEGAVPYRDAFEQKTPFVFALHGLAYALFGFDQSWGYRLFDVLAMPLLGLGTALSVRPRTSPGAAAEPGERPFDGVWGVASLAAAVTWVGYQRWDESGNTELWLCVFVMASLAAARSGRGLGARAAWAGFALGGAVLAKLPGVLYAVLPLTVLAVRAWRADTPRARWRALARTVGAFSAGAAAPLVVLGGWFWARGGLSDALDVVVRANAHYARHETQVFRPSFTFTYLSVELAPLGHFALIALAAVAVQLVRTRSWALARAAALPVALALLAAIAVGLQHRYFPYHHALYFVVVPVALATAVAHAPALRLRRVGTAALLAAGLLLTSYVGLGGSHGREYLRHARAAKERALGRLPRAQGYEAFDIPGHFLVSDMVKIADWLRAHSSPEDEVLVRAHEPEIYAFAARTSSVRFFWTPWLTLPTRAYRREAWLEQDRRQIAERKARFVVAWEPGSPVDAAQTFEALGYVRRATFGQQVVLERAPR